MTTVTTLWMAGVVLMMVFFAIVAGFGYAKTHKKKDKRKYSKTSSTWNPKPFQ